MPIDIKTDRVSKIFRSKRGQDFRAIDEVSISIPGGGITLLRGPSGSGKTTLLTLLAGLAKPTSGSCTVMGENISRWSEDFLAAFRRKHIGIIYQQFNLIAGLTVTENVMLPLLPSPVKDREIAERVREALEHSQIIQRQNTKITTLSGGEQQRVAIARALVNRPQIIFADEPTSHLDSRLSQDILSIFARLKEEGKTVVIATHDPIVENHLLVDQILCLRDGKIEPGHAC